MPEAMKVIVGLGNPGSAYQNTRHNAGFCAVECLAAYLGQPGEQGEPAAKAKKKDSSNALAKIVNFLAGTASTTGGGAHFDHKKNLLADIAKMECAGEQILLVKPTTYMNDSGKCVQTVLHWYKIKPKDMLVVHDDVSLPLGKMRLQSNGGAGGQHGIESIIESLGGLKDFARLKIGVGPDPGGDRRAAFVLAPISLIDRSLFDKVIAESRLALSTWLVDGIAVAANKFNGVTLNADD